MCLNLILIDEIGNLFAVQNTWRVYNLFTDLGSKKVKNTQYIISNFHLDIVKVNAWYAQPNRTVVIQFLHHQHRFTYATVDRVQCVDGL